MSQPIAGIAWFDVADPNSKELDELAVRFHLHELQIEDCRHRPQRAKADDYDSYQFAVLKKIQSSGDEVSFMDVDVFVCANFLITVHEGCGDVVERVRKRATTENVTRLDKIFYFLADLLVDEYSPVLDDISESSNTLETSVLERPEPAILRRIFRLKRSLINFRRVVSGMREAVNAVMRREHGFVGDDLDPYWRDVYDHLVRTLDLIESYRDLLTGTIDIYLSAVANRTNEVMKVLTVWGTVALPLVIITGFFGMNLHLPWQGSPHGLLFASLLMGTSTLLILAYFKWKKWF